MSDDDGSAADATGSELAEAPDIVEEVAAYDEELADEVADLGAELRERREEVESLRSEVEDLEAEVDDLESALEDRSEHVDDLESRLKRTQADFQNYKKRAKKRQEQLRERATEDLVERLVSVRDNLVRALEQDEDTEIRDGVEATLNEFDRVLDDENVSVIEPEPGDAVDPNRHEVMMRVASDEPDGTVASLYQPGYEMADRVIRPAQVTVSDDEA
ncbi:MAG: nucleotide exchange factor GrpE [Haloferacaceae archaeon]